MFFGKAKQSIKIRKYSVLTFGLDFYTRIKRENRMNTYFHVCIMVAFKFKLQQNHFVFIALTCSASRRSGHWNKTKTPTTAKANKKNNNNSIISDQIIIRPFSMKITIFIAFSIENLRHKNNDHWCDAGQQRQCDVVIFTPKKYYC